MSTPETMTPSASEPGTDVDGKPAQGRLIYALVVLSFVLWVVLLVILQRAFA